MTFDNRAKGIIEAIVSSASFGLIPLFTIPVMSAGMALPSFLVYRFAFGCLFMLAILIYRHENMHIKFGDTLRIAFLSSLYAVSAICLISGYSYMASGIATTLLFSYPVWTAILMMIFCHEKATLHSAIAIVLAVGGVFLLSGIDRGFNISSVIGLLLELAAGLTYAIYMVAFPHLRIRRMESLKLTFYVFFYAMIILMLYSLFSTGKLDAIHTNGQWINLALIGLLPTALSNVTLIMSLKRISSTMVAILGAFEPLTAMAIGIIVFGEPLTISVTAGFAMIISAVILLIIKK
jgi:drug/metabolite transporter (DMT)-like permease